MPARYRLYVVKAAEIVWETRSGGQRNPNPFVNVYFEGKLLFSTTTKQQTLAPLWDERVELESNDPTSKISFDLCHTTTSGETLSIGTKELTIVELEDRAMFNPNLSVILCDNHNKKAGVVAVRLVKEASPAGRKGSTATADDIPRELPPELTAPKHAATTTKIKQVVGFSEQSVSMKQTRRIVRQILARSSAANSNIT